MRLLPMTMVAAMWMMQVGCGSESAPGEDGGDGKYHPAPNQVRITEAAACSALLDAYEAQRQALGGCILTSRICPDYLQVMFGAKCIQYDQGSVEGCIAYYQSKTTCDELKPALSDCVITPYPETAPAGCP